MKICYITNAELPSRAANSVNVVKMSSAMASLGHEVSLTFQRGEETPDLKSHYGTTEDIRCVRVTARSIPLVGGVLYGLAVRRSVRKLGLPDFIYGRHLYGIASLASLGIPFAFELHQVPAKPHLRSLVRNLARRSSCMGIVVISAALRADLLAAIAGLPADRTFVAHDAADPPCAQDKFAQLNWPARAGALQVGYVGHLYPGKGMEVISNLAEQLPGIDFHVIGGTEQYIAFWRSQVSASNLHFHGFVEHSKLSAYYDRLDVCLAPLQRRIEGEAGGDIARWTSPLKIFEYMSTGKAIVASDIAVLREVLTHEVNALLAPPDDRDAWALALLRLQADPQLRSTLAETANRAFRAQHTWRGRAQQILNWCLPGNPRHSTGSLPIGARSMDVSDTKSVQRS